MTEKKFDIGVQQRVEFIINSHRIEITIEENRISLASDYHAVYGLGERYNAVNQKNHKILNKVEEQFCNQNEKTYFPLPFFFTDAQWGLFIDTDRTISFDFSDKIIIDTTLCEDNEQCVLFLGDPQEIIKAFLKLNQPPCLPPKWSFGPWLSAHRWNSEALVEEQLKLLKEHKIPATVMVLEQWSDEATFYVFEGAKYHPQNKPFSYDDFAFLNDGKWPNPMKMIQKVHNNGLHLLLWQCPIVKKLEKKEPTNPQHQIDEKEVISKKYIPSNPDGTPYTIPEGHWFPGSMIPDFTNQQARNWWFSKRKYLLDIGVDGFKTDGGEFVYQDDIEFHNGMVGKDMINRYSMEYVKSYHEFIGKERVLFSRAGYIGQQQFPIQWAGDQESTWSELRSVLNAGISAGSSGQIFWGFDIGGFAGDLPCIQLYKRALQMAVFTPIMQLHSEPIGGQFSGMRPTKKFVNDRTPWNMAEYYDDDSLIEKARFYFNLRMNLLPTIYSESIQAVNQCQPIMKHGIIDYPCDPLIIDFNEQYLFSHLLIAPSVYENETEKEIYLPEGEWYHLFTEQRYQGNQKILLPLNEDVIHVFVPSSTALVLNLSDNGTLGSDVGNDVYDYDQLTINLYGPNGSYHFVDEMSNDFTINWDKLSYTIIGECVTKINIIRI